VIDVEPRPTPGTKESSKDDVFAAMLFVFAVELVWLVILGSWIVRSVF